MEFFFTVSPLFCSLLKAAADETLQMKYVTDNKFEEYTQLYYSKSAALLMKRNRLVGPRCSQDLSPGIHDMHIALLATETADWGVFLQAHMSGDVNRLGRVVTESKIAYERNRLYKASYSGTMLLMSNRSACSAALTLNCFSTSLSFRMLMACSLMPFTSPTFPR